jgi:hypothetical protein
MKPKESKTSLIKVKAESLALHPRAQRDVVRSKVNKLKRTLDLDAIGVLHAVEYEIDGVAKIWVIDGGHRWTALMEEGLGDWVVDVQVYVDVKTDARAAALFLKLNERLAIVSYARYKNALLAEYPSAVGVDRLVGERELRVAQATGDGAITCVTALTRLYEVDNGEALAATLDTVIHAWGRVAAACEGKLIEGLGKVYANYNGAIERPALVKKLAKYPGGPSRLIGDAKGRREYRHTSLTRCVAELIVDVYNSGRHVQKLEPL